MTIIRQEDFVASVAGALQYISYYHPVDYITSLARAYEREESPAARDAIAQILINSRMCAEGHRPICQDTGIVTAFLKVGMDVRFEPAPGEERKDIQTLVDEGVRRAYLDPDNKLRASILADPAGARKNTKDNTPACVTVELVKGSTVDVTVAAKGGGSEAKAKFAMLDPGDSIVDWVLKTVPTMGAGWCPPGMLGIGIGGTAEKAMLLAKESLMDPIDIQELKARGATTLRGAAAGAIRQGQPAGDRRAGAGRADDRAGREGARLSDSRREFAGSHDSQLRGDAPRALCAGWLGAGLSHPPSLDDWPKLAYDVTAARRVNLER